MQNLKMCLWHKTGHEWDEISELYLNFRRQGAPFGKICVFTPDANSFKPRYYLPKEAKRLHAPHEFVAKYLNAKERIATQMPWVQFDLGEFPPIIYKTTVITGQVIIGSAYVSGSIKLRPRTSQNNLTLSQAALTNISYEAKLETANLLTNTFQFNFDIIKQQFSVSVSGTSDDYSSSLTINYPEIEAELELPPLRFSESGWDIELNASIHFKGKIEYKPPVAPPPITLEQIEQSWQQNKTAILDVTALVGIVALIIFTDGVGAVVAAAA
jgi:hypothetical protein